MKPAKVQPATLNSDQQLKLLTANARVAAQRKQAAEKKARLAKAKLKSARKSYKAAKKALKKVAKLTKQAHKELAKWQKHSAKQQKKTLPKSVVKAQSASPNKRKSAPAPKPPTLVDLSQSAGVPLTEISEPPKVEQANRTQPQAEPTPSAPATES